MNNNRPAIFLISCTFYIINIFLFPNIVSTWGQASFDSIVPGKLKIKVSPENRVKNLILLIPDGMGVTHSTLARWYKGADNLSNGTSDRAMTSLAIDELACGLVRTYSSNSLITDSAAAITAMGTGHKTQSGFLAVLPRRDQRELDQDHQLGSAGAKHEEQSVQTILEAAKLSGRSVGLVVTSEIQHATPAGLSAHVNNRNAMDVIAKQQVDQQMDVVLGGGADYLLPEKRKDKEDLLAEIKRQKYIYVSNREELLKTNTHRPKVWGAFAPLDLPYDFDRDPKKIPSLKEMTEKAIEILQRNKRGFFVMIEGSKIDWAAHANDPVGVISEVLSFDDAAKVAIDFAKKRNDTVVIIAADHSTGGLSLGSYQLDKNYELTPWNSVFPPLLKVKKTAAGVFALLDKDRTNIQSVVKENYLPDLSPEELKILAATFTLPTQTKEKFIAELVRLMVKRTPLSWTTIGHTGEEVVLYVYHPKMFRPTGVVSNTDIAAYMAGVLGIKLGKLD
ncbi:MAG: alkaline phosphatase [Oligoflexia bacterium]|nr:alkaline phosphatase [Oligoflexia bacterium]